MSRTPTHKQREAIATDADQQQEDIVASVLASGFSIDWSAVEREAARDGAADDPLHAIEQAVVTQLDGVEFATTMRALDLNGRFLAAWTQQRHEQLAGIRLAPVVTFAEADVWTPERALRYWQKKLGLSDETVAGLLNALGRGESPLLGIRERITKSIMDRITSLFDEAIRQGVSPRDFTRKIREVPTPKGWGGGLEDVTSAVIETEYRTNLTEVYSEAASELVLERKNTFPFRQFMAIRDSRVTWWLCGTLGKCGPNGRGYIAATDDEFWFRFNPPLHFRCRSSVSPISYLEARRMGILAADGKTKIAITGNNPDRPFGDPPEFATNPETGDTRRVEPQEGFGA